MIVHSKILLLYIEQHIRDHYQMSTTLRTTTPLSMVYNSVVQYQLDRNVCIHRNVKINWCFPKSIFGQIHCVNNKIMSTETDFQTPKQVTWNILSIQWTEKLLWHDKFSNGFCTKIVYYPSKISHHYMILFWKKASNFALLGFQLIRTIALGMKHLNISGYFYCCTVHFDICRVHSQTNTLLFSKTL